MPDSRPLPFGRLVDFALAEIADGRVAKGSKVHDLSVDFHGKTASTPFAPMGAAFAQDLVAAYLRGARILELDGASVASDESESDGRRNADRARIDRNAQPLLDEYLLASMSIELLLASGEIPIDPGFDHLVFDVTLRASLVHDAGSHALLRGMADSRAAVDSLRADVPAAFEKFRGLAFRTRLSDTVTLASEPSLPAQAVDAALIFLLQGLGVSCQVEIAPGDAAWSEAVPVLQRAGAIADDLGLSFGIKARAPETVTRVRAEFGDRFPLAFAGVATPAWISELVALGASAVGVPLDALQACVPDLCLRMDAAEGAESIGDLILKARYGNGDEALETAAAALGVDDETRRAAKAALAHSAPSAVVPRDLYDRWVSETKILNTKSLAARTGEA